ncbi:hypothetical protein O6H91_05G062500 [Diphasiastrum complanatum]|uniref:Uncharacterized protein n=2 Tax=Diphasiastrum complanatum TaxID=34168 RepID=A0ACC2DPB1_DIPCM|nr:hypothetical protein O6H91_05G062500 [Diphasiastrum complanatum]KAJ7555953.1 hypothetical protein O6H91_05G062500 [Diphasiastrum complanatum]
MVAGAQFIRTLVSKKRRRLVAAGYDLDMSYITDRLLAMSFPAQDITAMFRNPLWQVKRVLDSRHESHYKVYNLCVESTYDPANFHGRVEWFPFDDNHVPPLPLIKLFCENVGEWLASDPRNVAVVHCKAGKGRTGLMVCAYLVYTGMSAEEALKLYASRRTYNDEGVTIPSQRRYVGYWSKILSFPAGDHSRQPEVHLPVAQKRELRRIRLYDTLSTDRVRFVITQLKQIPGQMYMPSEEVAQGYCKALKKGSDRPVSPRYYLSFLSKSRSEKSAEEQNPRFVVQMDTERPVLHKKACLDHYLDKPLAVAGDVRAIFYDSGGGCLFYACFNTFFISNSVLQLGRGDLDKVGGRAKSFCGPTFCVELLFGPVDPQIPVANGLAQENNDTSF